MKGCKFESVTKLSQYLKRIIESDINLKNIYIKGEISNFKAHQFGHLYFSIKDSTSLINCVMFKGFADKIDKNFVDGDEVEIIADVVVYQAGGRYQLQVKKMKKSGEGSLYQKFEELKKKLLQEGLFDSKFKKSLPKFPNRIGVVTSSTGAVIQDIINVGSKRNPKINILLYPASVQGTGAEKEIVKGIEYFNNEKNVDVLIIGRGGGSIEDLWPFNEEIVARAIFSSVIPIISAVGHETDTTISDLVADVRAATPSQAAEFAVPNIQEEKFKIQKVLNRILVAMKNTINTKRNLLKLYKAKLVSPEYIINEYRLKISSIYEKFNYQIDSNIQDKKNLLNNYKSKIVSPSLLLKEKKSKLDFVFEKMKIGVINILKNKMNESKLLIQKIELVDIIKNVYDKKERIKNIQELLEHKIRVKLKEEKLLLTIVSEKINSFSPEKILEKGYVLISKNEEIVKKRKLLKKGDEVDLIFADGKEKAVIK